MAFLSKVPWRLVGPVLGMIVTGLVATYGGFDLCSSLWPDRCKPVPAEPAPTPAEWAPDAGK